MLRTLPAFLVVVFSALSLAACAEKPQRLAPESQQSVNGDSGAAGDNAMRARTLNQGEASRMGI